MGIKQTLKRGRRNAEKIMTDTVKVFRRSDVPVTDPETSKVTYPTIVVHEGIGRVQSRGTEATEFTDAGASVLVTTFQTQLPISVALQRNDRIEVIGSETDALMVGRSFRVEHVQRKSHGTKTVANVEEVA